MIQPNRTTVTLMVADLEKSITYYRDVLKLPLKAQYGPNNAEIDGGNMDIGLHPSSGPVRPTNGISIGFSVDDFDKMAEYLKQMTVSVKLEDDGWSRLAYFNDIDGHMLYLIERKEG